MIGIHAGTLESGLPLMRKPYPVTGKPIHASRLVALVYHCSSMPRSSPVTPAPKTRIGRMVGRMPMALSSPWTAKGVWQSHHLKPASRT